MEAKDSSWLYQENLLRRQKSIGLLAIEFVVFYLFLSSLIAKRKNIRSTNRNLKTRQNSYETGLAA